MFELRESTAKKITAALKVLAVFSFAGVALAGAMTWMHEQQKTPGQKSWCSYNDYLSCDIVNNSAYSRFFGIPVAPLGFLVYFFLFTGSVFLLKKRGRIFTRLHSFLHFATAWGFLYSMFLTAMELFVIHAVCILCAASAALMTVCFAATAFGFGRLAWVSFFAPEKLLAGTETETETERDDDDGNKS